MSITEQLLLMFSALGGLNAWLLAGYFFWRKPSQPAERSPLADKLLALLLLMLSIRVLKSVLFYFNPGITKQILQLGLSACALIGPLLFAYCHCICAPVKRKAWYLWPLLAASLLLLTVGLFWPYHQYSMLWAGLIYQLINFSWLGWIVLSAFWVWRRTTAAVASSASTPQTTCAGPLQQSERLMLHSLIIGNMLLWAAYHFASYTSYLSGALSFSFLLYVAAMTLYLHRHVDEGTAVKTVVSYANKKLSAEQAAFLQQELERLMQAQQLYLDANLSLAKLAKQLGWSVAKLSQLLNDNLQLSFNDYINAYRIQFARQLIAQQLPLKMADLAEQSGFNSLSTFYTAFKKCTGQTPARYKQQYLENSGIINPVSEIIS